MKEQRGGFREGAGRPKTGTTKSISLTLPDEVWGKVEEIKEEEGVSQSALLRSIVENYFNPSQDDATAEEKEQRFKEFKDFVFGTDIDKLTFHHYHHGLVILSPVEKVEPYYDDAGIKITFRGGDCHIWSTNLIKKGVRPGNLIIKCETCYLLYNEYEEIIGYLYTKK
jgi:predicted DNA-binding protein